MHQNSHSLFISDLHLCDSRPHISQAFIQFCEKIAVKADSLFILGDLFEYWAGDDTIETGTHQNVIRALKNLNKLGVKVFFMHGNRDFLLSDGFIKATKAAFLCDPTLIDLFSQPVLLTHGDKLCTDDVAYLAFRQKVRTDAWQSHFLSQPLANRIAQIEQIRSKSEQEKSIKTMQIMDVNAKAVENLLRDHHYPPILIHGHTHKPFHHTIMLDEHKIDRWVLGDWYEQGSYLMMNAKGCHSIPLIKDNPILKSN